MPIQRDLIRHQPWNGEISAKNARAQAIAALKQELESHAGPVTTPESNPSSLPKRSLASSTGIFTTQSELHLPDESRYHEVITLRKCPWCGSKPIVLKHKNYCQVVHMVGIDCDFGKGLPPLPMDGAKRAWNLAVKLCR